MPPFQPRTNIGTTPPPRQALVRPARLFVPRTGTALPIALPVAQQEGETPGPQAIASDPLWVSRWQPSATVPLSKAPWVVGYRWWVQNVVYQSIGTPLPYYRIDLKWRDHMHAYTNIPRNVWEEFRQLQTSVGQWFHRRILGPGHVKGGPALYPDFPL